MKKGNTSLSKTFRTIIIIKIIQKNNFIRAWCWSLVKSYEHAKTGFFTLLEALGNGNLIFCCTDSWENYIRSVNGLKIIIIIIKIIITIIIITVIIIIIIIIIIFLSFRVGKSKNENINHRRKETSA